MSLLFPCYLSPLVVDEGDSRAVSCLFMSHAPTDPKSASALLSGLPDEARSRALSRFQIIRSFLEDGVPLTQIAQEQGLVLRTARRWVDRYRREGLTGLARKERNDKDRRKLAAPPPATHRGDGVAQAQDADSDHPSRGVRRGEEDGPRAAELQGGPCRGRRVGASPGDAGA